MLFPLIISPLIGVFLLTYTNKTINFILNFSLFWSLFIFLLSILLTAFFDTVYPGFQFLSNLEWICGVNNFVVVGIDGLSMLMIILTTFLTPICIFLAFSMNASKKKIKNYLICFFALESILLGVFASLDLLVFYILFEAILIPMYFIVGIYGSRSRKVRASYLLFIYTLFSSILMLLSIIYIFINCGTTSLLVLSGIHFEPVVETFCWIVFFLSFAVKTPLVPFHIWLPEAHCEAPTAGSVILAGVLLKLGGYGFIRFSLCLFPNACAFFSPFVFLVSVLGALYSSITTLQQVDLKKIVAYSSIGHMGIVTIGIFCFSAQSIWGAIFLMLAHALTSSGLFLCIGSLYDKYGTRVLRFYGGLFHTAPLFSTIFMIFSLANLGLPGTSNFVGEFLIFINCFSISSWLCLLSGSSLILSASYSLWVLNRLLFGNIKTWKRTQILKNANLSVICWPISFTDINRKEFRMFLPLIVLTIFIGIFPEFIMNLVKTSVFSKIV